MVSLKMTDLSQVAFSWRESHAPNPPLLVAQWTWKKAFLWRQVATGSCSAGRQRGLRHLPPAAGTRQVLRPVRLRSHPDVAYGLCDFGLVLNLCRSVSSWVQCLIG